MGDLLLCRDEALAKESEIQNTPAYRPFQKIKGLPDLLFLCYTQAKCHNAKHYSTDCIIGLASIRKNNQERWCTGIIPIKINPGSYNSIMYGIF